MEGKGRNVPHSFSVSKHASYFDECRRALDVVVGGKTTRCGE